MLRLWGRTNSSNVMKVLWALDELGLPYERIDAGGPFGLTKTPEYLAMNPFALVPVLRDGDFAMFESNAINRYLCNAYAPDSPLYPRDVQQRGLVDKWLDAQQTCLSPPMGVVFSGLIRTPPAQRDNAAISAGVAEAGRIWAMLDGRLTGRDFINGADLTLADIAWGVHAHRWFTMTIVRPDSLNLHKWYDRLLARPGYARHVAQPLS